MANYTVQAGDTLSGIAAKNGVKMGDITGYASGKANLIRPGEVLSWGNPAGAAPAAPAAPAAASSGMLPDVGAAYQGQIDKVDELAKGRDALISRLNSQEDSNYAALIAKQQSQEKLSDAFSRLRKENGLDDLQSVISQFKTQIYNTKGVLNGLDANINDRTQGTLTTQGQQDRMRQIEGGKINDQLAQLANGLQPAEEAFTAGSNMLGQQLQFMSADQERELQPYKLQIQAFSDRAAREISGYNESSKSILDTNLARINAGLQLSTEEWKQTMEAAAKEKEYANQFKIASMQAANSLATAKISAGASAANNNASISATKEMKAAELGYPSWDAYIKALNTSGGAGNDRAYAELQASKTAAPAAPASAGTGLQGGGSQNWQSVFVK